VIADGHALRRPTPELAGAWASDAARPSDKLFHIGLLRSEKIEDRSTLALACLRDTQKGEVFSNTLDATGPPNDVPQAHERLDRMFRVVVVPWHAITAQERK